MSKFKIVLFLRQISLTSLLVAASVSLSRLQAEEKLAESLPPLSTVAAIAPENAAGTIKLQNGFRAELVAAEPLVTDPVAIAYDENGLAYVAEMNDYPYTDTVDDKPWADQPSAPIGRIRVLEDVDGDGIYDRSYIFADKLSWPAGVVCFKGGIYVAATPDLLYLKDTDGDHKADIKRVVFTGFRKYNVQAVMNTLQWGLDNKIYAAGSSNGGSIIEAGHPGKPVILRRADFRFEPGNEHFEEVAGGARFGNSFNNWGDRFLCNIRNPVQHVLFPSKYLKRNPYLPLSSLLYDVASSGDSVKVYRISPPESWRVISAERMSSAVSPKPFDSTQATGYITSSSGVTIYRGAAYPQEFLGNAFVGEVASNLVLRYQLLREGGSYRGVRPYKEKEFMASTDNWFRPVNYANAPDGTLHVLDMYRETIEHPWSLPDDLKARLDLTSGRDRGRIYRLIPPKYPADFVKPPRPQLGKATTAELVQTLENKNGWWRETAQRLLYEQQDKNAIPLLRKLLRESTYPLARLHALWTLQGLNALGIEEIKMALKDESPRVRIHAVRLAEPLLATNASLVDVLLENAKNDDMKLRYQVALSLGEVRSTAVTETLARMIKKDGKDLWMRSAVLSSLGGVEADFLLNLLKDDHFATSETGLTVVGEVAYVLAAKKKTAGIISLLDLLAKPQWNANQGIQLRQHVVSQLGGGLKRSGSSLSVIASSTDSAGTKLLKQIISQAIQTAEDANAKETERTYAIRLISYTNFNTAKEHLVPLLDPRSPDSIQVASVNTLTTFSNKEVATILLEQYSSFTPTIRTLVVQKLLRRSTWLNLLFDAMLDGKVSTSQVSLVRQMIYLKSSNQQIREKAKKLFKRSSPGERKEVVDRYIKAIKTLGDVSKGEAVFKKNCANCHQAGKLGVEVGPHLSTVKSRSIPEMIVNILDPNKEISPNFFTYVVVTETGLAHTGIVASETSTNITLRAAEKKETIIFRSDVDTIQNTNQSLMPVGLEKEITPQQMADLIAFIKAQ